METKKPNQKKTLLLKNTTQYFNLGIDGLLTVASAPGRMCFGFLEKTSGGEMKFDSKAIYVPNYALNSLGKILGRALTYYQEPSNGNIFRECK